MDEIELEEYDRSWPERFAEEERLLRSALPPELILSVDHIGSTAVPGMIAKPIIDLLIIVPDLGQARAHGMTPMLRLDYLFWEGNPDLQDLFFVKGLPPHGRRRTHHVHISEANERTAACLAFRDRLRRHGGSAAGYAELKRRLALAFRTDREAYTQAKSAFIAEVLRGSAQAPG